MENNQIKYIVYCTTCTINKKIYVGYHETSNLDVFDGYIGNGVYVNRPSTYERSKTVFQQAVKRYGPKNFIRNTIAIFNTSEEAYLLEEEIVNEEFLKREDVYNTALGGQSNNWNLTSFPTYQYDDKGVFIKEYRSMNEASKLINRSFRTIWRAIKEKCKCAGFYWTTEKYDKLDLSKMKKYEGYHTIPVFQYNSKGEYECCYDSISDAGRVLNIHSANISSAIKLGIMCNNKYFLTNYAPSYSIAKSNSIISSEVHQYGLDGSYIASYKNMQEAKNKLGIKTNIYRAIKLNQTCGGFQWRFDKFSSIAPVKPKAGKARRVGKFDKEGNLLKEYKSIAECKRENGSSMIHVLEGRNKFSKGYTYKYLND